VWRGKLFKTSFNKRGLAEIIFCLADDSRQKLKGKEKKIVKSKVTREFVAVGSNCERKCKISGGTRMKKSQL
jgi:hypothetical protein